MTSPVQLARREGYLHRVLVAVDQTVNVLLGGNPDETISARSERAAQRGGWVGKLLVWWLDKIQPNHGVLAEEADLGRAEIVERLESKQRRSVMAMIMRAKFRVAEVKTFRDDNDGKVFTECLRLEAVGKNDSYPEDGTDENNSFARWTPSAKLTMTIQNPDLFGKFIVGQELYADFTPVG